MQATATDDAGVVKKRSKLEQVGKNSSVQMTSPTAHASEPTSLENEPAADDDGGGEWKVVTNKRGKKKEKEN